MARLSLALLGGFEARLSPGVALTLPTRKTQALLAYLALTPGQSHPRDKLATLLWGDVPKEQARKSLRQTLFGLRKALHAPESQVFRFEGEEIALDRSTVEVDVVDFERLVAQGTPPAFAQAAALYRGELLEGLSLNEAGFEEWLMAERERLRELAIEALAKLLGHQRVAETADAAVQTALRLLALDPLQEPVHRTLMRQYVRSGRRGAALRHYQQCVGVLQRELGVEPEAETKELYQEILRQRPSRQGVSDEGPSSQPSRRSLELPMPALPIIGRAHEIDTVRSAVGASVAVSATEAPLIGREIERARLTAALADAWAGRGQLLAIIGETGIGKSRLVAAVAVEARQRGGRVVLGRCYEFENILPFGPWVDAFRRGEQARAVARLQRLDSVWRAELGRLLPELGDPPPSGPSDHLRLFEAVAHLLHDLTTEQPLVLVLEDLHWADEMSVRLLAFLGRRIGSWPVLVLVTAREEELGDSPILRRLFEDLAGEHLATVTLAPLSCADTGTLVRALARAGSDEASVVRLGERVWGASEGNPFMVVEHMRALQQGSVPETPSAIPLPERVRQVVGRRLERLGERTQQLAAVAAVIGREFDFALLQSAAGLDEQKAAEGLEELVRRRVVHGLGERFDFVHDAIRQVILGHLLPPRRKLLHRRVADALEMLHSGNQDSQALALGRLYLEGEVWEKAVAYLYRAGSQAVAQSAHREAVACYEQALKTLKHLPPSREREEQAIDLRVDLHKALIPLGEAERTGANLLEADASARAMRDQARLGRIAAHMTNYYWLAGDLNLAVESGERARAIAEALDDRALNVVAGFYLGQAYHFRGDYRRAIAALSQNVEVLGSEPAADRFGLAGLAAVLSQGWLAWSLSEIGEFAEGITHGEHALEIARKADHAFSLADACRELGCVYLRKGDMTRAAAVLEPGLELCQRRDLPLWFPSIGAALGYVYALGGRLEEATPLLELALERAASLGIRAGHSLRTAWLGEAYLLGGRLSQALGLGTRALELSRERSERGNEAWSLRLLGEIDARRDPSVVEAAEEAYRQALAIGLELGMRPLVAHCHLGLGTLHRRVGDVRAARAELGEAASMLRSMQMTFWLARANAELVAIG